MKYTNHFKILLFVINFHFINNILAQQRLVLNGAIMNISKGANLVVNNPASNAIIRNNGYIITEGENNLIKWNIGTTTGTYIIPLGYESNYIPLSFTKSAGTGNGYFLFSAYHTTWDNSAMLPTGVDNISYDNVDNSAFVIDRFWQINGSSYTIKPNLTNLKFTYLDPEWTATGNLIVEDDLGAQRWNSEIHDWTDFTPGVITNTIDKTVTIANVNASNFYTWWTLPTPNGSQALPVELIEFKANCNNGLIHLNWTTASEFNNDYFAIEHSEDGKNWVEINTVRGAGNSNTERHYAITDQSNSSVSYYRIEQTDYSGKRNISSTIQVSCNDFPTPSFTIFPNPSSGIFYLKNKPMNSILQIINTAGDIVYSANTNAIDSEINLQHLSNGIYMLFLRSNNNNSVQKLMIQH